MGKAGFWLRGSRGKLAGTTLYQSNGETLQREIVIPNNPQSNNQMRQRVFFTAASKFYTRAQQNRFVLAFQNKAQNQSDFNAFMKENVKLGLEIFPTREQVNDANFPLINNWIVAKGNLPAIEASPADDLTDLMFAALDWGHPADEDEMTWEDLIENNKELDLRYGDIITVTAVVSTAQFAGGEIINTTKPAQWITRQFSIGGNGSAQRINQYMKECGFDIFSTWGPKTKNGYGFDITTLVDVADFPNGIDFGDNETANSVMYCATLSRKEGSKLKVSNTTFKCSPMAQRVYTALSQDSQLADAIESYRSANTSQPTAVLEGALCEQAFSLQNMYYTKSGTLEKLYFDQGGTHIIANPSAGNYTIRYTGTQRAFQVEPATLVDSEENSNYYVGTTKESHKYTLYLKDWGSSTKATIKVGGTTLLTINKQV